MIKILFVCHGNICRSTMAQSVFAYLAEEAGLEDEFEIDSAATSREEIGNPPHYGTERKLAEVGIPLIDHRARQMTRRDYLEYDYLIGMDDENIRNMERIAGGDPQGKIYKMMDFAVLDRRAAGSAKKAEKERGFVQQAGRDVADPWYTGNFEATYRDVLAGCRGLLQWLDALHFVASQAVKCNPLQILEDSDENIDN